MKRRKFLTFIGVGTGVALIPPTLYLVSPSVKKYAVQLIKNELHYLKLEPEGVEQYVEDYFKADDNKIMVNVRWKTFYYLGITWQKSDQVAELIKYYLLSSNFFINRMDESKPVKYLGMYNPYKSPVPNPYSYILYPPETIN